jgi:hypothetical protein
MFFSLHFKQRLASRFRGISLPQRRRQQRNFTSHEGDELVEDMMGLGAEANTKTKRKLMIMRMRDESAKNAGNRN